MLTACIYIVSALLSYLLGAIPFGLLIGRMRGIDIRTVGSGNIGATNVFRACGKLWGILTFFLDALKGFIPAFFSTCAATVFFPNAGFNPQALSLVCGFAAIAGHNWPVYLRFKGGKGVATGAGAILGIAPKVVLVALPAWFVVFLVTRYVSVASILAAAAMAGSAWLLRSEGAIAVPSVLTFLAALTIWRHKGNIVRLARGQEHRFQFGKKGKT